MKVSEEELSRRIAQFRQGLKSAGIKTTHQRLEIFREVAQSGNHPDAETIYEGVRQRMPSISLDTVYRTLWLLIDLGIVNTMGPGRERMRFADNTRQHHHFVCIQCGTTQDFYCEACDQLQIPDMVKTMGSVEIKQLEVRGICVKCAKTSSKINAPGARRRSDEEDQEADK